MKIGDKVKVVSNKNESSICNMRMGQIGILKSFTSSAEYKYLLEFDTVVYGFTTAAFDRSEIKKIDNFLVKYWKIIKNKFF